MSDGIVGTPRRVERPAPTPGGGLMTREQGERLINAVLAFDYRVEHLERKQRWAIRWTIAWGIVLATPLALVLVTIIVLALFIVLSLLGIVAGGLGAAFG